MVAKTRIHLAIIGCLTEDKISSNWLARQWVKTNNLQLLPAMIEFQLASRQMLKRSPDSSWFSCISSSTFNFLSCSKLNCKGAQLLCYWHGIINVIEKYEFLRWMYENELWKKQNFWEDDQIFLFRNVFIKTKIMKNFKTQYISLKENKIEHKLWKGIYCCLWL